MSTARAKVRAALEQPQSEANAERDPILARTIARLKKARPNRAGLIKLEGKGLISVAVRPQAVRRATQILERLVGAAEAAGIGLDARHGPAVWAYEGETVAFELFEAADRIEHVPTGAELKAVTKWEAEREAYHRRTGYLRDWGRPTIPKWEERYQGRLAVRLEEVRVRSRNQYWGPVIRRAFSDSQTQDLVKAVPRILSTVAAIAVAKRENCEAEERRRLAREEAERLRAERERREAMERTRLSTLDALTSEHARIVQLETYLAALERSAPTDQVLPRVARLIVWLRARLERLQRQAAPAALEERLAGAQLFEEDGDCGDQPVRE